MPTQDWTRTETREDCASYNPLRNAYFGDTHVHTKYSADSVLARNRNTVRDAYNFAKGGQVELAPYLGDRYATIDRPLDFTAVTDHAEGFGEASICLPEEGAPHYSGYDDPICVDLRDTFTRDFQPTNPLPYSFIQFFLALNLANPLRFDGICGGAGWPDCATEAGLVWQDTQDAAEENYDRTSACAFTTFVAYEWSGNTDGNNLHRNVIFRNTNVPGLPISYYEQWKAEGLWAELRSQCIEAGTGCDVLAIPHNSNIARDAMFSRKDTDGLPLTAQEASTRASFEPIMEIFQIKGDSECRDGVMGTSDELCNFEKLSRDTLTGASSWTRTYSPYAYARGALKLGLELENKIGVNPFALGFVGATDTHNGVPGAVSEIDFGKIGWSGIADSEPALAGVSRWSGQRKTRATRSSRPCVAVKRTPRAAPGRSCARSRAATRPRSATIRTSWPRGTTRVCRWAATSGRSAASSRRASRSWHFRTPARPSGLVLRCSAFRS